MELLCSLVSALPEGPGWSEGRGGCVLCQPDLPSGQGKLLCYLSPLRQGREELAHFSGKGGGNDWVGVSSSSASHKESMRSENRRSYWGSLGEQYIEDIILLTQ